MLKIISELIKKKIEAGETLEQVKEDPYLSLHYSESQIEYYYLKVKNMMNNKIAREETKKKYWVGVRLDAKTYNLLGKNHAESIRTAILQAYAKQNP